MKRLFLKSADLNKFYQQRGVALFDMLIGLLIVSVGSVAFFGLQFRSDRINQELYLRTQAESLAASMLESMRSVDRFKRGNYFDLADRTQVFIPNALTSNPLEGACPNGNCSIDAVPIVAGALSADALRNIQYKLNETQLLVNRYFPQELYAQRFGLCMVHNYALPLNQVGDFWQNGNIRVIAFWLEPEQKINGEQVAFQAACSNTGQFAIGANSKGFLLNETNQANDLQGGVGMIDFYTFL